MFIRREEQQDFDEIYCLIKTAFETAEVSDGDEADYAVSLRNSDRYIPELALVAVENDKLIGQIMLTKNFIKTKAGKIESLLLSPISVAKEHRKKGVGGCLINKAFGVAKDLGFKAVFLCGDPDYYTRFGFNSVSNYKIEYEMDIPSKYVLVCELEKDWLKDIEGKISIV